MGRKQALQQLKLLQSGLHINILLPKLAKDHFKQDLSFYHEKNASYSCELGIKAYFLIIFRPIFLFLKFLGLNSTAQKFRTSKLLPKRLIYIFYYVINLPFILQYASPYIFIFDISVPIALNSCNFLHHLFQRCNYYLSLNPHINYYIMINFVKKVVAGPKRMIETQGLNLDLTYITDRVIAMAFPASGFQKTYRNSIQHVAKFLQKNHGENYLIINVSMRKYDYNKFGGRVKDYFWPDHQAPPVSTLFQICKDMHGFLANSQANVVVVHCNHGKGRTGTSIIAFLIFTGFCKRAKEALKFYNKRRFLTEDYGVSQPCQKRALQFFEAIKYSKSFKDRLTAFKITSVEQIGLDQKNYYMQISMTRTGKFKYTKLQLKNMDKLDSIPLLGDIFIEVMQKKWTGDIQMSRVNFYTEFITINHKQNTYTIQLKGQDIKVKGEHHRNFVIKIKLQPFCKCDKLPIQQGIYKDCECSSERQIEQLNWQKIKTIAKQSHLITIKEACELLFISHQIQMQDQESSESAKIPKFS